MTDEDLAYASVASTAERVRRGDLSAVEVVRACLARIEALDPRLHAIVTVREDQAIEEARAADLAMRDGTRPLLGVPLTVKDNIGVRDIPTTLGSPTRRTAIAAADAACVMRLRAAGAIVVATTNMWEFTCGAHNLALGRGEARNPWDLRREPGGSSTGSGVSVAAGFAAASIATDGGGSIRVPAALTGVVGLKPTFGRVDMAGVVTHLPSLDHVGPLARTAEDAALVLDALTPDRSPTARMLDRGVRGVRVGVLDMPPDEPVHAAVRAAVHDACDVLRSEGARERPLAQPRALRRSTEVLVPLASVDAARFYREELDHAADQLAPAVRRFLEHGRSVKPADLDRAKRGRAEITAALDETLAEVDILVCPTTPRAASWLNGPGNEGDDLNRYTAPFNLAGLPAIAVPCGFDPEGMPLSVQIVARRGADELVLRAAYAFQRATTWHARRPVLEARANADPLDGEDDPRLGRGSS